MSAIAKEVINTGQLEADVLFQSLASYVFASGYYMLSITGQVFALYMSSKVLSNSVLKDLKEKKIVIDDDHSLTDGMSAIQLKINSSHTRLNGISNTQFFNRYFVSVNGWMLRKAFDNFGLVITQIMEHDVDADNSYSESYESVDDLINFLDS